MEAFMQCKRISVLEPVATILRCLVSRVNSYWNGLTSTAGEDVFEMLQASQLY
jgi:hypothetical protein